MAKNNLYKKVSLEVGAVLNEIHFKHSIKPDTMQKVFSPPLRRMGNEATCIIAALD